MSCWLDPIQLRFLATYHDPTQTLQLCYLDTVRTPCENAHRDHLRPRNSRIRPMKCGCHCPCQTIQLHVQVSWARRGHHGHRHGRRGHRRARRHKPRLRRFRRRYTLMTSYRADQLLMIRHHGHRGHHHRGHRDHHVRGGRDGRDHRSSSGQPC